MSRRRYGESPTLQQLGNRLAAGQTRALDDFWQEIMRQGAPLIETIPGDDAHVLVTFLWRADEKTRNVVVVGNVVGWNIAHNQMVQLEHTDLWYKTYRLRSDIRVTYVFSLNDNLDPWPPVEDRSTHEHLKRLLTCRPDPLNPQRVALMPDILPDFLSSILELPNAPDKSILQVRKDVACGEVTEYELESSVLKQKRRIWLYTPASYAESREPLGALILLDGNIYLKSMATSTLLDNLIASQQIEHLITVFVDNPYETRAADLFDSSAFLDFLSLELLVWLKQHYRVTDDPAKITIGGSSAGGLMAARAAFHRPDLFGQVISQSGAFWWDWDEDIKAPRSFLIREFALQARRPIRFYLEVGYLENTGRVNVLQINRHMRDVLEARGYEVSYTEVGGDHEFISWSVTLGAGLTFLAKREQNRLDLPGA